MHAYLVPRGWVIPLDDVPRTLPAWREAFQARFPDVEIYQASTLYQLPRLGAAFLCHASSRTFLGQRIVYDRTNGGGMWQDVSWQWDDRIPLSRLVYADAPLVIAERIENNPGFRFLYEDGTEREIRDLRW